MPPFTEAQKKELDVIADKLAREMAFTDKFNKSGFTLDEYVRERLGDHIDDGNLPPPTYQALILYVIKQAQERLKTLAGEEKTKKDDQNLQDKMDLEIPPGAS
jgi:hypothetical protein